LGECIPGQPAPLIRMQPKRHYQLTLVNNAHIPTNLHTHGLHVSGVGSVDDVTRNVDPGQCLIYRYFILEDADVGTFWYHPHRHPLVTIEAYGGAYGMLIVDEIIEDYYPVHLENFLKQNEVLLQFSSMYNKVVSSVRTNRVNGHRQLNLILTPDVYYYFRISSVVYADSVNYVEFFPPNACESRPVAYDGVYRSEIPHPEPSHKHMLTVSSRLDLAVKCSQDATVHFHQGKLGEKSLMVRMQVQPEKAPQSQTSNFTSNYASQNSNASSLAPTVVVTPSLPSSPFWDMEKETAWQARRPYYMPNLNSPGMRVEDTWIVSMDNYYLNGTKGFSVNQVTWDPEQAIREFDLGQLIECRLLNTQTHPYHA